jgi:hypothetical protein
LEETWFPSSRINSENYRIDDPPRQGRQGGLTKTLILPGREDLQRTLILPGREDLLRRTYVKKYSFG